MTSEPLRGRIAKISVETVDQLTERDIHELSDAAESVICRVVVLDGCPPLNQ